MITNAGLLISSAPLVMLSITKPTSANVKQGLILDLLVKKRGDDRHLKWGCGIAMFPSTFLRFF